MKNALRKNIQPLIFGTDENVCKECWFFLEDYFWRMYEACVDKTSSFVDRIMFTEVILLQYSHAFISTIAATDLQKRDRCLEVTGVVKGEKKHAHR